MEYDEVKDALGKILNRAGQTAKEIDLKPAGQAICEIVDKLSRNFFYVAVLGQFKRGKSTFLNYILGAEILPSSVLPLTSVITKIICDEQVSAAVLMEDGQKTDIALEELSEYCTESKNPKNIKKVSEIQICYPFDFISRDTILIDTPGIASVFKHNTDVTYGFADKADAVIFMLSADPPISEAEKNLLASLSRNGSKLFFLLNKADYLKETELSELLKFNKEVIGGILNRDDVKIFPVSALLALKGKLTGNPSLIEKSGIKVPLAEIERYLAERKDEILRSRFVLNVQKVLDMEESFLKSSLHLQYMSAEEIQSRADAFRRFMHDIDSRRHEFSVLFMEEMKRLMDELDERMISFRKEAGESISDEICRKIPDLRRMGNLKKERSLKEFFGQILISRFEKYKKEIENAVETRYRETLDTYLSRVNDLISEITKSAEQSFGINLEPFRTPSGITAQSRFSYRVNFEAGQIEIDPVMFSFLMPKAMAEKIILRRILTRVDVDIDRNLGRLRYDITQRIKKSFTDYDDWLGGQIDAMNSIVTKLAAEASENAEKIRMGIETDASRYKARLDEISSMRQEIAKML